MSFVFMVFHWPEPEKRQALAQSMREMGKGLAGAAGCVGVEPPYLTEEGDCLIGISKWVSKDAFFASGITLRPPDEVIPGETRPRARYLLEEAEAVSAR